MSYSPSRSSSPCSIPASPINITPRFQLLDEAPPADAQAKTTEDPNASMIVTVKHLDSRYDSRGYVKITDSGPPEKPKGDPYAKYVLCLTRMFDRKGVYQGSQLEVKSPYMKKILRRAIGDYPGVSFFTKDIKLGVQPRAFFHYLSEIKAEVATLEGEAREHGDFLVQYIEDQFEDIIKEYSNLLGQGLMTYELLWTLFKPGTLLYTSIRQQPHCFNLISGQEVCGQDPHFGINASQTEFDGKKFGTSTQGTKLLIPAFLGSRKITELPVFPLEFHPVEPQMREMLIARGRRFEELATKEYLEYKGLAWGDMNPQTRKQMIYHVNGRVYIDAETFFRINPGRGVMVVPFPSAEPKTGKRNDDSEEEPESDDSLVRVPPVFDMPPPPRGRRRQRRMSTPPLDNFNALELDRKEDIRVPLTDEQCLTATALVRGFAFQQKQWLDFVIPGLMPIVWNEAAFSRLVLPEKQKKLVHSLVQSNLKHSNGGDDGVFDDIIKGKGQGVVVVLHGPPGSGKTLTAEATAELTHRPLYAVSSGELGTDVYDLEAKLSSILDIAATWRCVLLLDEADVFLEKRSMHDLNRNALVSIFLRLLEYYSGILFLTTNRVTTFDPAFQSRIHMALKYEDLGQEARKSVWRGFLAGSSGVEEKGLDKLAERPVNGREIKNAVKIATHLAEIEGEEVGLRGILEVLDMRSAFDRDFKAEPEGSFETIY